MTLDLVTQFFMWCTILNGGLLVLMTVVLIFLPGLVHSIHGKFFGLNPGALDMIIYCFLGAFKLLWIVFNLVPWVALMLVAPG